MEKLLPVFVYASVALGFTCPMWYQAAHVCGPEDPKRGTFVAMGGFGPTLGAVAAVLVISMTDNSNGEASMTALGSFFHDSVLTLPSSWEAVFVCALVPFAIIAMSLVVHKTLRPQEYERMQNGYVDKDEKIKTPPNFPYPDLPGIVLYPILLIVNIVIILEEIGWRAFLRTYLVSLSVPSWAITFIIGTLWAFWHFPLFLPGKTDPKRPAHPLAAETYHLVPHRFGVYWAMLTILSGILHTILNMYPNDQSVWLPVAFHASLNSSYAIGKPQRLGSAFEPVVAIGLLAWMWIAA